MSSALPPPLQQASRKRTPGATRSGLIDRVDQPELDPEMLTAKELEGMLKIDVKTIYGYVQRGLIPYVRIQSNLRFSKPAILAWIEEQSHSPRLPNSNGSRRY